MYRYICFVWDKESGTASAAARLLVARTKAAHSQYSCATDVDGLALFHAGERPRSSITRLLANDAGAIFGTLFTWPDESGFAEPAQIDGHASSALVASEGHRLIKEYWGRYVAVVHSSERSCTWVLRDPSGTMPCFFAKQNGVHIFFSSVEDCVALGLVGSAVNWDFVAAFAAYGMIEVRETGLLDVSEVHPGECLRIGGGSVSSSLYWDADQIVAENVVSDPPSATADLRRLTRACTHAWASCYNGILHKLSGGLDSSIVAVCLADAPSQPAVHCLNYSSAGVAEDERRYARMAARKAGLPLVERRREAASVRLENVLNMALSPKPQSCFSQVQRGRFEEEYSQQHGLTAIFSGGGGDALFYQACAQLAPMDFVAANGIGLRLFFAALDAARIERLLVWSVLLHALRWRATGSLGPTSSLGSLNTGMWQIRRGVRRDARTSLCDSERWMPPRVAACKTLPPGKYWHVFSSSFPPNFYSQLGDPSDPELVYPLTSQPLVELCLQTPTYVLINGGWDRSIARQAFSSDVPTEIVRRRAKGCTDDHVMRVLERNRKFVREFLLDGLLVSHGVLDREVVDQSTQPHGPMGTEGYIDMVLDHLSTEAWLRRWKEVSIRRAVA